jgi:hypothetical protein
LVPGRLTLMSIVVVSGCNHVAQPTLPEDARTPSNPVTQSVGRNLKGLVQLPFRVPCPPADSHGSRLRDSPS